MIRTRRAFLKSSLQTATLLSLAPRVPSLLGDTARAAVSQRDARDTILVVIELPGGNDGLNTVVPYTDDAYHRSRPTLRLPVAKLHRLGHDLGLHPQMGPFHRLFEAGHLAVVQGVGYPNPDENHQTSMRIWQAGSREADDCPSGWLGSLLDAEGQPAEAGTLATYVGPSARPFALNARQAVAPVVRSLHDCTLHGLGGAAVPGTLRRLAAAERPGDPHDLAHFVERTALTACADVPALQAAAAERTAARPGGYPEFELADQLRTIAQLIRADWGIRIYFTDLSPGDIGGFDNHAGQAANHGVLLGQLSTAVTAFLDDLRRDRLADRVLLMTFSEFGRTVAENGRRGTDHGAASCLFLAGPRVRGGVVGKHPSLTDLERNGLRHHTDFRSVYATVLERWLGFPSQPILHGAFPTLDVV